MLRLIDISNNQGYIDFDQLAAGVIEDDQPAGPCSGVICKASGDEGGGDNRFVDRDFPRNWAECARLGLVRGAYHYARPSVVSPGQSVALFAEAIDAAGGLSPGDLVALDMEDPAVPAGESLRQWTTDWLDQAALRFGVAPLLYTGNYYMAEHDLYAPELGARYPLWLASYQATRPPTPAGWERIAIWQNDVTVEGAVPGVATRCDVNVFEGTAAELRALGVPGAVRTPVGELRDRTWALAEEWAAEGWPWASQVLKGAVALTKGER